MTFSIVNFSLLILSALALNDVYTIQEAQECFHSKALKVCQDTINNCLAQQQCVRELHFFHDCNFEKEYENQIFNGNCFWNWRRIAMQSRDLVECFNYECDLIYYNSEVSLPVLYSCSSEALVNEPIECDQQCQQILSQKISKRIPYEPLKQIYSLQQLKKAQVTNEAVLKIVDLIERECIQRKGSIKRRHQDDILQKKFNKQKMIDLMNKKNTTADPFVNQNNQTNDQNIAQSKDQATIQL